MNNRGKPLSHLELLKNRLIFLSTKFNTHEYEKDKLRSVINEAWKSVYHYLGKNKDNPLDDDTFLFNHFMLQFGHELSERDRRFYGEVRRHYAYVEGRNYRDYLLEVKFTHKNVVNSDNKDQKLTIKDIYAYVQSLKDSVEIWYQLLNPHDSQFSADEKLWLEKLNRVGVLTFAPLVMVFYQKEKNAKMRVRLLKALERYLFIRTFPRRYGTYVEEYIIEFEDLSAQLLKIEIQPDKVVKDIEQRIDDILSKKEYIDQVYIEFKNSGFYNWRGIRYFLFEYELDLKDKSKSYRSKLDWQILSSGLVSEDNRDFYTVEHVYPQRPRKPCWTSKFQHYNDRERTILRNSLGNLVPLSQPKNSSFQNKCFEDKKGEKDSTIGFKYGSYSENEVANYNDWTAKEILERGLKMLDFLERRWKIKIGDREDKIKFLNLEFIPKREGFK